MGVPRRLPEVNAAELELLGNRSRNAASNALPVYTAAGRPAAGADQAGVMVRVRDSAETQVQVCVQNSAGGWEWVAFGVSS